MKFLQISVPDCSFLVAFKFFTLRFLTVSNISNANQNRDNPDKKRKHRSRPLQKSNNLRVPPQPHRQASKNRERNTNNPKNYRNHVYSIGENAKRGKSFVNRPLLPREDERAEFARAERFPVIRQKFVPRNFIAFVAVVFK